MSLINVLQQIALRDNVEFMKMVAINASSGLKDAKSISCGHNKWFQTRYVFVFIKYKFNVYKRTGTS